MLRAGQVRAERPGHPLVKFAKPIHRQQMVFTGRAHSTRDEIQQRLKVRQDRAGTALIDVLSALPDAEVHPLFRQQWENVGLRERLLLELAESASPVDRDKFLGGLASVQSEVLRASLTALLKLLPGGDTATLAAMRLLRRLVGEPKEQLLRAQVLELVRHETRHPWKITESGADAAAWD